MPTKKDSPTPNQKPQVKISPEKQRLVNMILKWSRMVDNPKKKAESDALFREIWKLRDRMNR